MKKIFLFASLLCLSLSSYAGEYYAWGDLSNGELGSKVSNPVGEAYIKSKFSINSLYYDKPLRCSIKNKINNVASGSLSMYMRTFDSNKNVLSYRTINLPIRNGWQNYYMTLTSSTSKRAKSVICGIRLKGSGKVKTKGYKIY